jgi:hypothetical protein
MEDDLTPAGDDDDASMDQDIYQFSPDDDPDDDRGSQRVRISISRRSNQTPTPTTDAPQPPDHDNPDTGTGGAPDQLHPTTPEPGPPDGATDPDSNPNLCRLITTALTNQHLTTTTLVEWHVMGSSGTTTFRPTSHNPSSVPA